MIEDEEIEEAEVTSDYSNKNRKKIMILLLPLLIVIGASVGIYFALNKKYDTNISGYNIVQYNKNNKDDVVVFYDMPELKTVIMGKDDKKQDLRIKLNLEISNLEDLKIIEALSGKFNDIVLSHIIELKTEEISGSEGLYWLKEELLYRLNLATNPVKIKNINFSVFELL